jgi:DNA transposition AAA+ family ATPase
MTVVKLPAAVRSGNLPALWPTATTRDIGEGIENCRLMGHLGLITGRSGIGKTTAALAAVKAARDAGRAEDDLAFPTVVYVCMTIAARGLQPGLLRIADALRLRGSAHCGAHDVHELLVRRPWDRGSLIVLDEAQFVSDELLHGVRGVWDELKNIGRPIGIALLGSPELSDRINSRRVRANPFDALRGRIGMTLSIDALDEADNAAICQHFGITGTKAEKLVRTAANSPGGLHKVRRLLALAESLAADKTAISFSDLKRAAEVAGVAS